MTAQIVQLHDKDRLMHTHSHHRHKSRIHMLNHPELKKKNLNKNGYKGLHEVIFMYNIIFTHSVLDLTSEYISSVNRKKLTWNLQRSNSQADWIKAEKPLVTIVEVTSQAPKKKHLSPSTRKRNSQRLKQWKAKRNQAVVNIKVHTEAQTDNLNTQIDDTTQTDQQNSHNLDHNTPPRVLQKRERSTQSRNYIKGYQVSK